MVINRWSAGALLVVAFAGCGDGSTGSGGASSAATTTGPSSGSLSNSTSGSAMTSSTGSGGAGSVPTVFLILLENHDWSELKGSASAPYINGTLLPQGAHAEQYYNPPGLHPSEPNYLWLEAGTNFGILDDNDVDVNSQSSTAHLVTQLETAGLTWKSYQEDIDGTECPLFDVNDYAARHNPMVFFEDVTNGNDPMAPRCIAHVRPYGELATDLANGSVAAYNFITPNLCHDGHDVCPPQQDSVKQIDDWLASAIPPILASASYQANGVIMITWDESENDDGPIGFMLLSKYAKPGGYSSDVHYTHSSTLRTLQEMFKLSPPLGDAANATDLADLFTALP